MKKFFKISIWAVCALGLSALFYACSQDDLTEVTSTVANEDFTVRVKNGYLEFKDQATFDEIKESLKDANQETMDAWEVKLSGFTSLRSIEDQSEDAQEAWFQELRNMSEEDRNLLAQGDDDFWYSDYLKENADLFVMQDSGIYSLNAYGPQAEFLNFLNKEFIYKVGDEIRVYQDGALKTILDGDDKKISMLSSINETNEKLKISVAKYTIAPFGGVIAENGRQELTIAYGQSAFCANNSGRNRISSDAYVAEIDDLDRVDIFYDAVNYYRDGLFGGYTRKRTSELRVEGALSYFVDGTFRRNDVWVHTTGGQNRTRLRSNRLIVSDVIGPVTTNVSVDGDLDTFGRGGTRCGDIGTDNTCNNGCDIWQ